MYIYALHNLKTGKLYVGQTTRCIRRRFLAHCNDSKREDTKLYRAMRKYGLEAFIYYEVDTASSLEELNEKEDFWIKKLDTIKNGYNSKPGGLNAKLSKETRDKISKSRKGIKFSESHRKNLSTASQLRSTSHLDPWKKKPGELKGEKHYFYGKTRTEEVKNKISKARKGHEPWNKGLKAGDNNPTILAGDSHPRKGTKLSEEGRRKLSEALPKVAIKCVETQEEFKSITEAAEKLGLKISSISKVVNGLRNSVYGYTFKKIQEEI